MLNKNIKIITIVLLLTIFQILFTPIAKAASPLEDILSSGDSFIQEGKNNLRDNQNAATLNLSKLQTTSNIIYNVLLTIGIAIAVIVGAILGVQFMWGSIEQKTKAKEALMPYAIGCVVVFGAFGIWKLCVMVLSNI